MSLRSPAENEIAKGKIPRIRARNDKPCHLERRERAFSSPIFQGGSYGIDR